MTDPTPAVEALFEAACALLDEFDDPAEATPLSDHYRSQAEARLRDAVERYRALTPAQPVTETTDLRATARGEPIEGEPAMTVPVALGFRHDELGGLFVAMVDGVEGTSAHDFESATRNAAVALLTARAALVDTPDTEAGS